MDEHAIQWLRPEVLLDALFTEQLHETDIYDNDHATQVPPGMAQEDRLDVRD